MRSTRGRCIGVPVGRHPTGRRDPGCVHIVPPEPPAFPGGEVLEGAAFTRLECWGEAKTGDAP